MYIHRYLFQIETYLFVFNWKCKLLFWLRLNFRRPEKVLFLQMSKFAKNFQKSIVLSVFFFVLDFLTLILFKIGFIFYCSLKSVILFNICQNVHKSKSHLKLSFYSTTISFKFSLKMVTFRMRHFSKSANSPEILPP